MGIMDRVKKAVQKGTPAPAIAAKLPPHPAVGALKATGRKWSGIAKASPGAKGHGYFADYVATRAGLKVKDIDAPLDQGIEESVDKTLGRTTVAPGAVETPEQKAMREYGYNYESIRDAQGNLKPGFAMNDAKRWLYLQKEMEGVNRGTLLDNATRESLGQRLGAETALAARGGLMGGARERLMRSGMQNTNAARQGVRLQSQLNNLGLEAKAEDLNRAATEMNIKTRLGDVTASNLAKEEERNRYMAALAAERQARATARG